jgi:hypothetical protein
MLLVLAQLSAVYAWTTPLLYLFAHMVDLDPDDDAEPHWLSVLQRWLRFQCICMFHDRCMCGDAQAPTGCLPCADFYFANPANTSGLCEKCPPNNINAPNHAYCTFCDAGFEPAPVG